LKKYKDNGTIFEEKTRDDREDIFIWCLRIWF
jgi:hypothetical protein